jgi:hypothetical protein
MVSCFSTPVGGVAVAISTSKFILTQLAWPFQGLLENFNQKVIA